MAVGVIALLDACVLYPAVLRDVLLTLAEAEIYQIRWTSDVLDEMERNLIKGGRADGRVRRVMESAFPDAMVTQGAYFDLVEQMPNDPKDRHVLAAAIASEADVLVTANTKHFRHLPPNCAVTVQHPDVFLNECLTSNPRELIGVLQDMADDRNYPLDTVQGILNALHKTVPNFAMQAFDVLSRYLP